MYENPQATETARSITLRLFTKTDLPFVRELYASTRSDEMAMVPWTDEQRNAFVQMQFQSQVDHYRQHFPLATQHIILEDKRAVGRLYIERLEKEINIIDVTIAPQERNSGIGTFLLRDLIEEADRTKKILGIYVENFNPSLNFFKRLGFVATEEEGIHVHLQWFPEGVEGTPLSESGDGL